MLNKSKLWAFTLLLATFVAGAAVGSAVAAAWGEDRDGRERGRRERMSYAERLDRALDLTPAQRESVEVILRRRQQAMRELWERAEPAFDSLRAQVRQEILAQLDSAQQATYQQLISQSDSAHAARKRGGKRDK